VNDQPMTIHGRRTSSNVQKVLWFCDEVGQAYTQIDLGGPFGGNDKPEYLKMNPNGLVPTLVHGDFVLWESNAILRYLGRLHRNTGLYPEDPQACAIVDQWVDWQTTTLSPGFFPAFFNMVRKPPAERDMAAVRASAENTGGKLAILDARLGDSPYVGGAEFTIADIPVGIVTYRWFTLDIPRQELPNLARWYATLQERAPFKQHIMQPLA
jgi:glutathione S-transferase